MTNDEIDARVEKASLHYHALLVTRAIASETYTSFMRDLYRWAESRRSTKQESKS